MRWPFLIVPALALAAIAGAAIVAPAPPRPAVEPRTLSVRELEEALAIVRARVERPSPTPEADALAAVRRGEFGLITAGRFGQVPPGVTCFTPRREAPQTLVAYRHGDAFEASDGRWYAYATAYNLTVIARPDYPDTDICRASVPADAQSEWHAASLTLAARPVTGPTRSLYEAGRRGDAAEVRRWLETVPADRVDGMGMTALTWAMTRDNRPAGAVLLAEGANPWLAPRGADMGAVYWAAALGRADWFAELAARPGRPFERWPGHFLGAALSGGNQAIIDRMLREPHAPLRLEMVERPLPPARLYEPFLRDDRSLAQPLLLQAADYERRLDLVTVALAHGANPDARGPQQGNDPALVMASHGFTESSVAIVDALLRAGANPNMDGPWRRPLWTAVGTLHLDGDVSEIDGYATAIFHRLLAAGADINLPDNQGRPPIWTLLFPYRWDHRRLDASFVRPALLELLVRHGLDLNARQAGERVLPLVEAQAGRNSELAASLRRLGARR